MVKNEFENFYKELNHVIQRQTTTLYPIMGIIHNVSISREYVDVKTEDGIIANIPAHGFPVVGDSCIIHFINGNIEQPVCDCARRLSPPADEFTEMITHDSNNYHSNGDFGQEKEGYTGNFEVVEGENFIDSSDYCAYLDDAHYLEFVCDISECKTKYFKFQANHKGNGILKVECYDDDTDELIHPAPPNLEKDISLWVNPNGRFTWNFNKEAYLRGNTKKVRFRLTNCTSEAVEELPKQQVNGELVDIPIGISVDGILVYDENSDNGYYLSSDDMLKLYDLQQQ